MITGINCLRILSVTIPDWETNFTDLQANDFGNFGKNNSGNILVGNHAVIFTEINSPRIFSVGNICVDNGRRAKSPISLVFSSMRSTLASHSANTCGTKTPGTSKRDQAIS